MRPRSQALWLPQAGKFMRRIGSLRLTSMLALLCASSGCASVPKSPEAAQADEMIAGQVYSALNADPVFFFRHVDVRVDDGTVYLAGYVWSDLAIYRAQRVASAVPGVKRVVDQLELEREGRSSGGSRGR